MLKMCVSVRSGQRQLTALMRHVNATLINDKPNRYGKRNLTELAKHIRSRDRMTSRYTYRVRDGRTSVLCAVDVTTLMEVVNMDSPNPIDRLFRLEVIISFSHIKKEANTICTHQNWIIT
ncbi:b129 [miniopterid betaherpesvirus 1]|uniref:B129 n=1 Tax=miniopterid betaherpesvirus 1 TaxID=3070189 RepID=I3VQC6_9BETA|nr:b129 [miniopterid betaherpesvirus 1]AFK83970.1 b129 [miniopterid betaherpesvirus 1]